MAEETTGVDVIVGGHDNSLLSNTIEGAKGPYPVMVGDTAIVQAYAYGKFLGELNVTFDDEGVVTGGRWRADHPRWRRDRGRGDQGPDRRGGRTA